MEGPMILAHPNIPSSEGVLLQPLLRVEAIHSSPSGLALILCNPRAYGRLL